MRLLEHVSDGFISSAIGKITGYLKLTEAMAGATLLAFSNGATDIITTVVASGNDDGDDLAVGALFGACTFALTVILGAVILVRPGKTISNVGGLGLACFYAVAEKRQSREGPPHLHYRGGHIHGSRIFQNALLDRRGHSAAHLLRVRLHGLHGGKGQEGHYRKIKPSFRPNFSVNGR